MNLREWLFKHQLKITYFAAVLKVDRTYVHKWMKGQRIPSEKIMKKIREMTIDQVGSLEDLKDIK
jgi:transcriptional regulator with XRE-family HTH domain